MDPITGLSSMATKHLLADLSALLLREHGLPVRFTSAGGVEVARRVRDGERADVLVLGSSAMAGLDAEHLLVAGSLRPLFVSEVVAAVPENVPVPPIETEDDLRAALTGARMIAYSTGPSGTALVGLLEQWGLLADLQKCLVQAPPGVSVGSLLAGGDADLGFQQRSEMMNVTGVRTLGGLPGRAAIRSTFSGAVLSSCPRPVEAERVLQLLGSEETDPLVRAGGMVLADGRP